MEWKEVAKPDWPPEKTIIYSGHEDQDHNHTQGVTSTMTSEATKAGNQAQHGSCEQDLTPREESAQSFNATHQPMQPRKGTKKTSIVPYRPQEESGEAKTQPGEKFMNVLALKMAA